MSLDTDVVVIGAGPVGLMLANLLGGYGVDVVVLEAREELIDYPRAVGVDDEALRSMQTIGLVEKVLPHTVPDQKIRIVNGERKILAEIDPTTREFGYPRRNGFVQPLVDKVLLDGLERFASVTVRFRAEATGVAQDADSATVTVRTPSGDEVITAKYVVSCEGGTSSVRKALGIGFDGETRTTRGLVIDVANDPIGTPHAVFGGDPTRGYATLSLPHGIRRWEFSLLPGEDESLADDDEFVHGLLKDHVPDPAGLDIIRRRVYSHHARVAARFQDGRVLLAGDAAHIMPVVAGQGWNSGIRDALNLGWKLAAVVKGTADDSLVQTYEAERMDHVKAMVALSLSMANLVTDTSKVRTWVRDRVAGVIDHVPALKARVNSQGFKPLPKYDRGVVVPTTTPTYKALPDFADVVPTAGTLFPQPRVRDVAGRDLLLDDATGQGWRVLAWNNDPTAFLSDAGRAGIERLSATLVQVVPVEQLPWAAGRAADGVRLVGDPAGVLKNWFDARPVSVVVLRPDHIIAAECLAQELDATLTQLFAAARLRTAAASAQEPQVAEESKGTLAAS